MSSQPSKIPTSSPTISSKPSAIPTASPTVSVAPSSNRTVKYSNSTSSGPTSLPTVSSEPSAIPTLSPTVSVAPNGIPSVAPTLSIRSSSKPTGQPTRSVAPSVSPKASIRPDSRPTGFPTVSSQPSKSPTLSPTISYKPSKIFPTTRPAVIEPPSLSEMHLPTVSHKPSEHSIPTINKVTKTETPTTSIGPSKTKETVTVYPKPNEYQNSIPASSKGPTTSDFVNQSPNSSVQASSALNSSKLISIAAFSLFFLSIAVYFVLSIMRKRSVRKQSSTQYQIHSANVRQMNSLDHSDSSSESIHIRAVDSSRKEAATVITVPFCDGRAFSWQNHLITSDNVQSILSHDEILKDLASSEQIYQQSLSSTSANSRD